MSNYLIEIENEFSRLRGRPSRLSPLDWQLAQAWEDSGLPLHIVLRAMSDVAKQFESQKRGGTINSLSYFGMEVTKQFTEWRSSQVGKSTEKNEVINNMKDECFTSYACSDHTDTLDYLVEGFTSKTTLPEPLASSVAEIRRDLIQLIEEIEPKQLSTDDIETRLREMAIGLTVPLVTSVSEQEREALITKINRDYSQIKLDEESRAKILTRQLYDRFNLPELTLFEI